MTHTTQVSAAKRVGWGAWTAVVAPLRVCRPKVVCEPPLPLYEAIAIPMQALGSIRAYMTQAAQASAEKGEGGGGGGGLTGDYRFLG